MHKIVMGAHQHIGKREEQQDAFGWRSGRVGAVAVVADGMGGHAGGATASRLATERILELCHHWLPVQTPESFLTMALEQADAAVVHRQRTEPALREMGTTVVAVAWRQDSPDRAVVAHCGDSRAYVKRTGRFNLLTRDHALPGNRLVQCIGIAGFDRSMIDTAEINTRGAKVMLTTDGLHNVLGDKRLAEYTGFVHGPEELTRMMVTEAANAGGRDNITALIVEF